MGLFTKKPAPVVETSYQDVLDYLRSLEQADYTKMLKVVDTYRDADKRVKKILNIKLDESIGIDGIDELLIEDDPVELPDPKKGVKK